MAIDSWAKKEIIGERDPDRFPWLKGRVSVELSLFSLPGLRASPVSAVRAGGAVLAAGRPPDAVDAGDMPWAMGCCSSRV